MNIAIFIPVLSGLMETVQRGLAQLSEAEFIRQVRHLEPQGQQQLGALLVTLEQISHRLRAAGIVANVAQVPRKASPMPKGLSPMAQACLICITGCGSIEIHEDDLVHPLRTLSGFGEIAPEVIDHEFWNPLLPLIREALDELFDRKIIMVLGPARRTEYAFCLGERFRGQDFLRAFTAEAAQSSSEGVCKAIAECFFVVQLCRTTSTILDTNAVLSAIPLDMPGQIATIVEQSGVPQDDVEAIFSGLLEGFHQRLALRQQGVVNLTDAGRRILIAHRAMLSK